MTAQFTYFKCPNCEALYQQVRFEGGLETTELQTACEFCGAPLPERDGSFASKYFLLRKSERPIWRLQIHPKR
jgi:hypothetical protein